MRGFVGSIVGRMPLDKQRVVGWVTFVGSTAAIRDSFGVSSVTRLAAGNYTITWANPFGYAAGATGYAVVGSCYISGGNVAGTALEIDGTASEGGAYTIRQTQVITESAGSTTESNIICVVAVGP